jgi:hypothetical protein
MSKRHRKPNRTQKDPSRKNRRAGYWAVAFLDITGYGAALNAFDVYPLPRDPDAQKALNKKIVRPWHFKRRLVDGVKEFIAAEPPRSPSISRLSPADQKIAATWRAYRIQVAALGDAVTMEMALEPNPGHFPAGAITHLLVGACAASLLQLAVGSDEPEDTLPLRGGIDIGTGAVFEGQLYSAALSKAVKLEDEAVSPRILVGDRLREYVASMSQIDGTDLTSQFVRQILHDANGFFFQDDDGRWCLDVLGEAFRRRVSRTTDQAQQLVANARTFVDKALVLYQDNDYLLEKYRWLDRYMKSRAAIWTGPVLPSEL